LVTVTGIIIFITQSSQPTPTNINDNKIIFDKLYQQDG